MNAAEATGQEGSKAREGAVEVTAMKLGGGRLYRRRPR
jgi:ribosomal protein L15